MKQTILLATAIIAFGAQAMAQTANRNPFMQKEHQNEVTRRIFQQQLQTNIWAKTTGSGQRLMSITTLHQNVVSDSTYFTWGGNRELEHFSNPLDITNGSIGFRSGDQNFNTKLGFIGRYPIFKPDTAIFYRDLSSVPQTFGLFSIYNTANFINYQLQFGVPFYSSYTNITYTSSNSISSIEVFTDTTILQTGGYALDDATFSYYDSNSRLFKDSVVYYLFSVPQYYLHEYFYDSFGNDTAVLTSFSQNGSPISYIQRTHYGYNQAGQLSLIEFYELPQDILTYRGSYTYTGLNTYPNTENYVGYSILGTVNFSKSIVYDFNASGDVIHGYGQNFDNFSVNPLDSIRYNITYNTFNNPVSLIADVKPDGSTNWMNNAYKYNYRYYVTQGIETPKSEKTIALYPNPSSNEITLQIDETQSATATVQVLDAMGRTVQVYNMKGGSLKMNVGNLASGIYTVQYQSNTAKGSAKLVRE